jgi:hypothetical protein
MYEYQVRGWLAWHHHIALSMMATYFMLSERLLQKDELPLLSCNDIRECIIQYYSSSTISDKDLMTIMKSRHERRKKDIEINLKKPSG